MPNRNKSLDAYYLFKIIFIPIGKNKKRASKRERAREGAREGEREKKERVK